MITATLERGVVFLLQERRGDAKALLGDQK
jgi:hypothetical protein